MRNLRIWQKLLVMGAVFMLPFAVVTYTMVSSINTLGTEFARQEMRGLEVPAALCGSCSRTCRSTGAWPLRG